jgi:hypothetical protein
MMLAYLDPGSGSLIASALVGGVAAAGVAAKQARARFSTGFGRKRKPETELAEDGGTDTADDATGGEGTSADDTAEVEVVDATSPAASDS